MIKGNLLRVSLMLLGVAIASMLLLGPVGLNTRWADTPEAGFVCGLTSCGTGA